MDVPEFPKEQEIAVHALSQLEWMCNLSCLSKSSNFQHTTIIPTLGKSSRDSETIVKMVEAGAHLLRICLTLDKLYYHEETIKNVRIANEMYNEKIGRKFPLALALEIKGQEIRTGSIEGENDYVELKQGATIKVINDKSFADKCTDQMIYIDYERITKHISVGDKIYINEGLIVLVVNSVFANILVCTVELGWKLRSKEIVNIPGVYIDLPIISEFDKHALNFCLEQKPEIIIIPYVRSAETIQEVKRFLGPKAKDFVYMSKIHDMRAMDNLDEILRESNACLIARGEMGVELPQEKAFIAQKNITGKCNALGIPCVCGYQFLKSMLKKLKPNRGEVADITNAILDGCTGILLSSETYRGNYPVECIEICSKICKEAESAVWFKRVFKDASDLNLPYDCDEAIAISAVRAAVKVRAAGIITCTGSGKSAICLAKYQTRCPIFAVTRNLNIAKILFLYRSIIGLYYEEPRDVNWLNDMDKRVQFAMNFGIKEGLLKPKDPIVLVTGWKAGTGFTNTIRIVYLSNFPQTYVH